MAAFARRRGLGTKEFNSTASSSFTAFQIDEELAIIQEAIRIERKIASSVVWKDIWKGADLVRIRLLYYMAFSDILTEEDAVELCVRDFPSVMWYKFCYCMCVIELYLVPSFLMLAVLDLKMQRSSSSLRA